MRSWWASWLATAGVLGVIGTASDPQFVPFSKRTPIPTVTPAVVCPCDSDGNGRVSIAELVRGVRAAMRGCE